MFAVSGLGVEGLGFGLRIWILGLEQVRGRDSGNEFAPRRDRETDPCCLRPLRQGR